MATRNRRHISHSTVADDVLDLEALRKEDSSWHPCRVSLSSSGVELIVNYGNADSEEIIVSEEEAIARLRIRSIPLVGDDCVHIQEGDHVLATQKSQSQSLFFDAEVEKALRVRHSKKVHCRCTFVIKWLHQVLKGGTLTVSSSSVMKLAAKSINEHPIVSAFLGMLVKNMDCSSPSPPIIADMDSDIDINELLEKQITIISSLADMSKKKGSDNIVFRAEVDCKEQNPRRATAVSKLSKSHVQASPDHNHLKRATRSTKKLQTEMEVKDQSPPAPSIQEQQSEIRSPLNPLAARAAFASLMSKMSQIATSVPIDSETKKDANSLISTISASGKSQLMAMGASSVKLVKETETETNTLEISDSRGGFACSVVKRKLSQPSKVTRLTRSAIKEGDGIPADSCVEQKLQPSIGPRRFTRSAVCKAKEPETVEAKQRTEEYKPGKHSGGDCSEHNIAALKRHAFEDEKLVTSRNVSAVELFPTQDRSCLMKKEDGNKTHEVVRNGLRNSTSRSRFTRSAGHEENGNKLVTATQGLEEDKLAHNTKLNSCKGNVTSTKSSVLETTIWSSSPVDAEGDFFRIEDKHNVEKMSSALQATEKTEGNGESSRSLKRKFNSPKELRSSPRLQSLPKTRSQNKS